MSIKHFEGVVMECFEGLVGDPQVPGIVPLSQESAGCHHDNYPAHSESHADLCSCVPQTHTHTQSFVTISLEHIPCHVIPWNVYLLGQFHPLYTGLRHYHEEGKSKTPSFGRHLLLSYSACKNVDMHDAMYQGLGC